MYVCMYVCMYNLHIYYLDKIINTHATYGMAIYNDC